MIYHTTGSPTAKTEGDRIVVSFPSGGDKAQHSLTLGQAMNLYQMVQRQVLAAYEPGGFASKSPAEVIRADLLALPVTTNRSTTA